MNGFKTNAMNRKRKQQLSRDARKFVRNRLNSYHSDAIEFSPSDLLTQSDQIKMVSMASQVCVETPTTSLENNIPSVKKILPIDKPKPAALEHTLPIECHPKEGQFDLRKELAEWSQYSKIPAMHVDSLLQILRTFVEKQKTENLPDPKLPKCAKTLLKTPRTNDIIPMDNGHYLYFSLKNYLERFLSENVVAGQIIYFDIGSDGVGVAKSSTSCLWPLLVNIIGFPDIFLVSCFHGMTKPQSANNFLEPFVEEFLKLKDNFEFNGKKYLLRIRGLICDAPARAFLLNIISHSGYYSCSKCTIRGRYILHKVVFPEIDSSLRTDYSFRLRLDKNHHHSNESSSLECMLTDCVSNVPIDIMHCVYLGVVKQLMKLWIGKRRNRYSISRKNIALMSEVILLIGPQLPNEFQRYPRHLKYMKYFKATEFRQLALYTLPLITAGILKPIYHSHLLKLVCAMRILCSPSECLINNELAEQLLKDFVRQMERLYGPHCMSFNVHGLLHLAKDVRDLKSNSESFSAFKFENVMQHLKKTPRSGNRVLEQIHNRIIERNFNLKPKVVPRKTKVLASGLYEQVVVNNMILSTKAPNNYIKIDEEIGRIQEIYKNDNGEITVKAKMVLNLTDIFHNPISSSDVNMFKCEKEIFSDSVLVSVSNNVVKIAAIRLRNKMNYIALLH